MLCCKSPSENWTHRLCAILLRWIELPYLLAYSYFIIILMSCRLHGYPWPSLATSPYHSSPLAGLLGNIPYSHIAAECMFNLVVLLLLGHVLGPQEYITYELVPASPAVSGMSGSSRTSSILLATFLSLIVAQVRKPRESISILLAAFCLILVYYQTIMFGNILRLDRMLRAILNKSWWQHPTWHQLYGLLPPITKTIQIRRTRHAGHYWRSRDELISDVLLWTPTYGRAKAGRPARTYIQQLCEDTGCSPEDLPEAMNDREEWRERIRDIRANGTTWWWDRMLYL